MVLAGDEAWPEVQDLAAHLEWRAGRACRHSHARPSGTLAAERRARCNGMPAAAAAARQRPPEPGRRRTLLQWLRIAPELGRYAPGAQYLDLQGDTLLDVDLRLPGSAARQPPARARDHGGARWREPAPLAGLPPIEVLRGTLAFADGHLQHSRLTGQWLGGPVSLAIGERREHGTSALTVSGRGLLDVRQVLLAAGADSDATHPRRQPRSGPRSSRSCPRARPRRRTGSCAPTRASSGSRAACPNPWQRARTHRCRCTWRSQGDAAAARLHLNIGERLAAVAALERSGDAWRIERGALRLCGRHAGAAVGAAVGSGGPCRAASSCPPSLSLWQQAARSPAAAGAGGAPERRGARCSASAFTRTCTSQRRGAAGGGQLELESARQQRDAAVARAGRSRPSGLAHLAQLRRRERE